MAKQSFIILLLALLHLVCNANGMPLETRFSSLKRTTNPMPRQASKICVLREDLYIKPGKTTDVHVKYTLHNNSDKDDLINYGFPVDYLGYEETFTKTGSTYQTEDGIGWRDDYVTNIKFIFNGKLLEHTKDKEFVLQPFEAPVIFRRWFYTQFKMEANETVLLEVIYTVRNENTLFVNEQTSKASIAHDKFYEFTYDLSPAKNWGKGYADQINIIIDNSNFPKVERADRYVELHYSSNWKQIPLTTKGDSLCYSAKNFAFQDKTIVMAYLVNTNKLSDIQSSNRRLSNDLYTLHASKEIATYPLSNLNDQDLTTAWAIPYTKNDSLVISFKQNINDIASLSILAGYWKNKKTYTQNCRPLFNTYYVYHKNGHCQEYHADYQYRYTNDDKYEKVTPNNLFYLSWMLPLNEYHENSPIKKIVIPLDSVKQGTKYNDLCISEILLLRENKSR